jgi:hypothetical protein
MPKFKHDHQSKLPDTKGGKARAKLRWGFASSLFVPEKDNEYFPIEAISIIIPIIVGPHVDAMNDGVHSNQSGTLTVNCSLPINMIKNKILLKKLESIGYTDTFPCSIIFYTRKCCGTYYKFMCSLEKLGSGSNIEQVVVESIRKKKGMNTRDYIGNLFDDHDRAYHNNLMERLEGIRQDVKQEDIPRIQMPFTYDIMVRLLYVIAGHDYVCHNQLIQLISQSKWSIVFDMVLDIQFYLNVLKAGDAIKFILFVVSHRSNIGGIRRAHEIVRRNLLARLQTGARTTYQNADGAALYEDLFREISEQLCLKANNNTIDGVVDTILKCCQSNNTTKQKKMSNADKIDEECCRLRDILMGAPFFLERAEANDFIRLATVIGFVPLHYIIWLPHDKADIESLSNFTFEEVEEAVQQNIVQKLRKQVSNQFTGPFIYNILSYHNAEDSGGHSDDDLYYYYQCHRKSMQHFFRIKFDGKWCIQMLRDPIPVANKKRSKTLTIANWNKENKENQNYLHWKQRDGCVINKETPLVVPKELRMELLNEFPDIFNQY